MLINEMPLLTVPCDAPPALDDASGLLNRLVEIVSQLEQHQNPHKTLHLTARCIEIFEGLAGAFREPPSTFEDVAEALGSLRQLEL